MLSNVFLLEKSLSEMMRAGAETGEHRRKSAVMSIIAERLLRERMMESILY